MLILTHDGEFVNSNRLLRYYCVEGKYSNITTIYAEIDPENCVVLARYYSRQGRAFEEMRRLCEEISQHKIGTGLYKMPDDEEDDNDDDDDKKI